MGRPALYSFLLHVVVFLLLFFGIPWFPKEQPEPMHAIPVEVMTIAEETMAPKPAVTPVKEEPKIEEKKPEPQPEPEKQTPPPSPAPEPEPQPQPEEPTPAPVAPPEPPTPEPLPTPDPAPKPEIKEPAPEPQAKPVPPKPKEKGKPKKQEKQEKPKDKKPEKKKKEDSFDSILKNLEDLKQKVDDDSDASTDPDAPAPARQVGKVGDALTMGEENLIRSYFLQCWNNITAGTQGADNLVTLILLTFTPDGTIKDAEIVDKRRLSTDPYYRSAAEAALRAAKDPRCAKPPIPSRILKKYSSIKLNFNP
ncbi:immunoglobulin A1 protease autotransporter precursor [Caedimonas varicaedens]|uniref:Immunoglobulin A1 protease autotransporter n=1 Tax=Caedimonas varicaedens TaxID=1629334 RepID=A0A0K8MDI1_9PROT|nr:immunoglobulin A1 protease autotransporter precursor [Caedimonas varicaedens]